MPGFTAICIFVVAAVILANQIKVVRLALVGLISYTINFILRWYYPIKSLDRKTDLPSLPYKFPNGQGNVEKFLRGRENTSKWASQYGPLYRLWSGTSSEIVLTSPIHVETVFKDSHNHIKAHANNSGYLMEQLLGSCLGLISGHQWTSVKSGVEAAFLHHSISQYATEVQEFTTEYLQRTLKKCTPIGRGRLVHPVRDLKLLPFLFVARVVYGPLDESLENELLDLIPIRESVFHSVIGGGITRYRFSRYLPIPAIRKLRSFKSSWEAWNDRAYARAERGAGAPIIAMYKAAANGDITREQLLQTLDEILFANIDVTMGGLSWSLVFLAAHADVRKSLREEIASRSTNESTRKDYLLSSWTRTPTLLGASILEAARLRPLAAFSVPQACPTPRTLDGFVIPAGTNFVVDSYALNIRSPFWGPDRDRYRPDRWLEKGKGGPDLRYRYWRFGFGPRTCLGKHLAELILRSVVVIVLEHWELSLEATTAQMHTPETGLKDAEMNWPWDDETWIHSPDLLLRCEPLATR